MLVSYFVACTVFDCKDDDDDDDAVTKIGPDSTQSGPIFVTAIGTIFRINRFVLRNFTVRQSLAKFYSGRDARAARSLFSLSPCDLRPIA